MRYTGTFGGGVKVQYGYVKRVKHYALAVVNRISEHHGTQLAASISYYALFALFPAAIALTALAALFIDDGTAKRDVVDFLFDELPVTASDGRGDLEQLVNDVTANAGTIGIISLIGLLISASALMTALRNSMSIVYEVENRRSFVKGKAFDVALVIGLGLLVAASVGGTLLINIADQAKDDLGPFGDAISGFTGFLTGLVPIAVTAVVFTVLLTVVPAREIRWSQVWPAVAIGTACFELFKRAFALYLDNFSNYSAVYGSLGAIVAFMFFVYLSALLLLASAELAAIRADEAADEANSLDARPANSA